MSLYNFLCPPSLEVAQKLLGCLLVRKINGRSLIGKIVETEAYDQLDSASHSFRGMTERNSVMFGDPGFAYVYFTYGMHYSMNIVTGHHGHGSAVLIRALQPINGIKYMKANRPKAISQESLTNGPAKLCQAMKIDRKLNGHDLSKSPLKLLIVRDKIDSKDIVVSTRIGIKNNTNLPWRFYIKNNSYVSKL